MGTGEEVRGYRHLTRAKRTGRTLDCYGGATGKAEKNNGERRRRRVEKSHY
jgi:hypothetical protein